MYPTQREKQFFTDLELSPTSTKTARYIETINHIQLGKQESIDAAIFLLNTDQNLHIIAR